MSESGAGKAAGILRSIGSAFGKVRRLVPGGGPRVAVPKPAKPPRPTVRVERPAPLLGGKPASSEPSLIDADRKREALRERITKLESELETIYSAIAACSVGQSLDPRTSSTALAEHIARQRAVKEELFQARLELSRVERFLARERRLRQLPETEDEGAPAPPRSTPKKKRTAKAVDLGAIVAAAHKTLKGAGADPDLDRIAESLRSDNPDVRRDAVARLGETDGKTAFALLMVAVDDKVERVRVSALHALARTGNPAAVDVFRGLAHDSSAQIRLAALRGLATAVPEARRDELLAALDDADPDVRKAVASMLGWQHVVEAVRPLCFLLRDPEDGVRVAAAQALGDLRDDAAVLPLLRALNDARPRVAEAIVTAMVTIAGDDVRELVGPDPAAADVQNLIEWWKEARVTKRIERLGLTEMPVVSATPAAVREKKPPRVVDRPPVTAATAPAARPAPAKAPAAAAQTAPTPPKPAAAPVPAKPAVPEPESAAFESLLGEEIEAFSPAAEAEPAEAESGAFESLLGGEEEENGLPSDPGTGVFESLVPDESGDEKPEPKKLPK